MENKHTNANRILRLDEVKYLTGLGRSSIYAYMKDKKFPQSIALGERAIGWSENEIQSWIKSRIKS